MQIGVEDAEDFALFRDALGGSADDYAALKDRHEAVLKDFDLAQANLRVVAAILRHSSVAELSIGLEAVLPAARAFQARGTIT